jgi:hypothetical protein
MRGRRAPPLPAAQQEGEPVVALMQIIEFRTADITAARQIDVDWLRATEGKRTARRELLASDHSGPERYLAVMPFGPCESAMGNSTLPDTEAAAEQHREDLRKPARLLRPGCPAGAGLSSLAALPGLAAPPERCGH